MSKVVGSDLRVIVVVPTYNEADNIRELADRVLAAFPGIELLIVDDNSPDGTGDIADEIAAEEPRFHVIHRTRSAATPVPRAKDSPGAATTATTSCSPWTGTFLMTPRGSRHSSRAREAGAGLVIGSRYIEGGAVEAEWGPIRRAVSVMGSRYARAMIGTNVHDCTSGYRCYTSEALDLVDLKKLHSEGYTFLIEVLAQLTSADVTIAEVPITYTDRQRGVSKISKSIVVEALIETTWIGIRRLFHR